MGTGKSNMPSPEHSQGYIGTGEFARLCGLSKHQASHFCKSGKVNAVKIEYVYSKTGWVWSVPCNVIEQVKDGTIKLSTAKEKVSTGETVEEKDKIKDYHVKLETNAAAFRRSDKGAAKYFKDLHNRRMKLAEQLIGEGYGTTKDTGREDGVAESGVTKATSCMGSEECVGGEGRLYIGGLRNMAIE